jgi:hypothetical protein
MTTRQSKLQMKILLCSALLLGQSFALAEDVTLALRGIALGMPMEEACANEQLQPFLDLRGGPAQLDRNSEFLSEVSAG